MQRRRAFWESLGFHFADWEESRRAVMRALAYLSRYTANPVEDMLDWDPDFLGEMLEEVGKIIERENKSGNPSF